MRCVVVKRYVNLIGHFASSHEEVETRNRRDSRAGEKERSLGLSPFLPVHAQKHKGLRKENF